MNRSIYLLIVGTNVMVWRLECKTGKRVAEWSIASNVFWPLPQGVMAVDQLNGNVLIPFISINMEPNTVLEYDDGGQLVRKFRIGVDRSVYVPRMECIDLCFHTIDNVSKRSLVLLHDINPYTRRRCISTMDSTPSTDYAPVIINGFLSFRRKHSTKTIHQLQLSA
jgi:hypothetical protein